MSDQQPRQDAEMKRLDIKGIKHGRLLPVEVVGNKNGNAVWLCKCDCGKETKTTAFSIRHGHTKSCGCFRNESSGDRTRTHGARHTTEYNTWHGIKQRCLNPRNKFYHSYGGRGITVCERWKNSFAAFLEDMGTKPKWATSLERINNDGIYEASNCKWADWNTQANNRSKPKNLKIT